jgi:hypothetical protein
MHSETSPTSDAQPPARESPDTCYASRTEKGIQCAFPKLALARRLQSQARTVQVVIHGGIDGFSSLATLMSVSDNNRAAAVRQLNLGVKQIMEGNTGCVLKAGSARIS